MRNYHVSDTIAKFSGSWWFIAGLSMFMAAWMLFAGTYDPYPYILLNLVISVICVIQGPFILMTQWRNEARDRERNEEMLSAIYMILHNQAKVFTAPADKHKQGGYGMRYFEFNGRKIACTLAHGYSHLDYFDVELSEPILDYDTVAALDEKTADIQQELLEERSLLKNQFEAYMD